MPPTSPELEAATAAARAAGALLMEQFGSSQKVYYKGETDIVTEMDRRAEALIARMLQDAFPAYGFFGEESGDQSVSGQTRWLVDPLDGTTNYAHSYPFFAVSIGLEEQGQLRAGVVYNPLVDELFAAQQGSGATLNGRPIQVSGATRLGESLLASGFPGDAWSSEANNGREWNRLLRRVASLRSDGAAALDLCYVASGRLDGFWELQLGPWDMAAGALIVREAGGTVTQANGDAFSLERPSMLASNGHLHAQIKAVLVEA